ncbi:MAG: hypothetical protein GXY07_15310 [Candidatus Hydrogenedentes bacterium]|nr:hypothetical protein [Candidatus Hydrogenedentota bacterium]
MWDKLLKKSWLTPLTTASFLLVGGTGVAMLFEAHHYVPGMKFMHEWMGPVFALAVLLHLLRNWQAFLCYFKKHLKAVIVSLIVVLVMGGALMALGASKKPPMRPPISGTAPAAEMPAPTSETH